jgi:hypothetical protein
MSVFDERAFARLVETERDRFTHAKPFPHLVADDLFDPAALRAVAAEFGAAGESWTYWHHVNERKRGLSDRSRMGSATKALIAALETTTFLAQLERLTGVDHLLADPHLDGGGLHETLPGGFLNVHTDFLSHTLERSWRRELNLLLFLNENWKPDYDGALELWDESVSQCVRRIDPLFNRCVIFRTSATSFHGVPTGVRCPENQSRKSLALYYFQDTGHALRLKPTHYVPRPADTPIQRLLIRADRTALRAYSLIKRYTPFGDALISKLLRKL